MIHSSLGYILITVTKLNGNNFMINAIYIETVDSFPDTVITLTNGSKFVIKESKEEVQEKIQRFYRSINLLGRMEVYESEE